MHFLLDLNISNKMSVLTNCCFSVAIDMSPAQNSLLELKLAAIRELNHKEFVCLLGDAPGQPAERLSL